MYRANQIWCVAGLVFATCSYDFDAIVPAHRKNKWDSKKKSEKVERILANLAHLEKITKENIKAIGEPVPETIYLVGYEDRFVGMMEMPLKGFVENSDIPSHRIRLFREAVSGDIVWNGATKFTTL